jgi:L-ascorbate metabolism protein UlaG (beta-lactamase superfamily)
MPTIIKNYRNSFIDVTNDEIRMLMDPWVSTANVGSWAASKNGDKYILNSIKKREIDYIYISHLHTDHFDSKFLKKIRNNQKKKIKIIIKKFNDNRLKNQILLNGFQESEILDIPEFEIFYLGENSKMIILPQMSTSNTKNEYINYDLDTSCVFIDENVALYNQVDNPYSEKDLKFIIKKLQKKIQTNFDLAFIPYCAASEYPQSFINLKRLSEKNKLIDFAIKHFLSIARNTGAKNVIPAGGTYLLDNIFSSLNKFLAVPKFNRVNEIYKLSKNRFKLIDPEKFFFIAEKKIIKLQKINFKKNFQSIIVKSKNNIEYNKIEVSFSKKKIIRIIKKLEENIPSFRKNLYDMTKTAIEIHVWPKQPILINNLLKHQAPISHKIIFNKEKKIKLKIHLYYKLLLSIIYGKVSWNSVANHCLYEREPNIYDPDAVFWMNFYKFLNKKI